MAVDSLHSDYEKHSPQWHRLRDAIAGQSQVHAKKTAYLPKLSGQDDAEYKAYLGRATFYGATSRTVDGLSGMIFRKPPIQEVPSGTDDLIEDVTLDGLSLQGFAEQIVDDIISVGRCGILVDHPSTEEMSNLTKAQAEVLSIRPFLKHYKAESITYWRLGGATNKRILSEVRLLETVEEPGAEEFDYDCIDQIRVLDFNEVGQYRQRVYRKDSEKDEWVQFGDEIYPQMNGQFLDYIPFFFVNVKNSSPNVEKPPLIDLADVNFSHYKTTADLEHGAHFTALPTAVITGYVGQEDGEEFRIGSATAWVFASPETDAKYLEFQGQGLESLEKRLSIKEQQMAFLGARMLAPDKKAAETAETAQIHRLGENSILSSIAQSVSETLELALMTMFEWAGITGEVKYELNRDFVPTIMSPQQLVAIMQLWQAGGIAFNDLMFNLKRGEIIDDSRSVEEIEAEIQTENPFNEEDLQNVSGTM